jgi:hypothetical protein
MSRRNGGRFSGRSVCGLGSHFPRLLFNWLLVPVAPEVAPSFCGSRLIDKLVTSEDIISLANSLLKRTLDI